MSKHETVATALAKLERQMDLFPRVILDVDTFYALWEAVDRHAINWDYDLVHNSTHNYSYMLRLGNAEELRDQVRRRIADQVAEQLLGTQK